MSSAQPQPPCSGVVIFLDIDGVLLPFGHADQDNQRLFPDSPLVALAHILRHVPTAQLVLSSTWRVQPRFIDLIVQDFQAFGGILRNVNVWDITDPTLHSERQHEIYAWLEDKQHTIQAWVALDDEELLQGAANAAHCHLFQGHLVKTDSHAGLTMDDARLAVRLLQTQLAKK